PVELGRVVDQLGVKVAQVPVEQHAADIEHHRARNVSHAKGLRKLGGLQTHRVLLGGRERIAAQAASALARLEAAVGLVDHVSPAAAADHAVVAVAALERLEAVDDLHGSIPKKYST